MSEVNTIETAKEFGSTETSDRFMIEQAAAVSARANKDVLSWVGRGLKSLVKLLVPAGITFAVMSSFGVPAYIAVGAGMASSMVLNAWKD